MKSSLNGKTKGRRTQAGQPNAGRYSPADKVLIKPDMHQNASPVILLVLLIVVFGLTWVIHYPEIVTAKALFQKDGGDSSSSIVEFDVARENLFRLDTGQVIRFRMDGYPYKTFGVVYGRVKSVFGIVGYDRLSVQVDFPDGLTTDRNFRIPPSGLLRADAFVQIRDYRLIQRIFNRSKK
jgi:hypothetical protein